MKYLKDIFAELRLERRAVKYPLNCQQATRLATLNSRRHTEQSSWFSNGQWDGSVYCSAELHYCNLQCKVVKLCNIATLQYSESLFSKWTNQLVFTIGWEAVLLCSEDTQT